MFNHIFLLILLFLSTTSLSFAQSLHDFKYTDIEGKEVSFADYKGKVLLLVNTASECGYTYQYEGLEKLYAQYKDKGLVVIAFPSNQFGGQEPGIEKEIQKFCKLKYGVTFPLARKIDVNGTQTTDFYKYLKSTKLSGMDGDIKWNFEKILVDQNGIPVARFRSKVAPDADELTVKIKSLLKL